MKILKLQGSANLTMDVIGHDADSTRFGVTGTAGIVGGGFTVEMAKGLTVESSLAAATGSFAGVANSAVAVESTGLNVGNTAASQTITINGKEGSAKIEVKRETSADVMAQLVNSKTSQTGVTAEALTQARLSNVSTAGTVSFKLVGTNNSPITISASVTGSGETADLSALANAINERADQTGITAKLDTGNSSLVLEQKTGADIKLIDFTHSAGKPPSAENINSVEATMKISGLTQEVDQLTGAVKTVSTAAQRLCLVAVKWIKTRTQLSLVALCPSVVQPLMM
ncbi:flagellin hook IN motif-containing protein [Deefgea sp. CFH1-16]|uniref:flagellin hook IN motif-containing protein n=1 Tax=Deefgea sp. CFH1-16 TaxID=2675457 RepID=UPI0015F5B6BA|nr:flagellin hook IN motif-containing protein [Deefgea sp. CFH1-16]MBM5575409.1 hypothetical protein [Deefgea sp. CFH1-16]